MLEQLINLIRQNTDQEIINNPEIPNEQNEMVMQATAESLINGLRNQIGQGHLEDVIDLFIGNRNPSNTDDPLVQQLSANTQKDLSEKLGLNSKVVSALVAAALPVIINKLVKKTNDPGDSSIDLAQILKILLGNRSGSTQPSAGGSILNTINDILKK